MQTHKLYLSYTRSVKSYGGVPALGFVSNVVFCYFGYFLIGQGYIWLFRGYIWLILFLAIHAIMMLMVEYDPHIFRIIEVSFDTFTFRRMLWDVHPYPSRKARQNLRAL